MGAGVRDRLHGMYAFAVWDSVNRRLSCARDPVGEKPFYYATSRGALLFASELKAVVGWSGFARRIQMPTTAPSLHDDSSVRPFLDWTDSSEGQNHVGAPLTIYRPNPQCGILKEDPSGGLIEMPPTKGYCDGSRVSGARPATLSSPPWFGVCTWVRWSPRSHHSEGDSDP